MTDRQLLGEFVDCKSQKAFADLVGRHMDWVYSSARRLVRDAHLAEDVAQAVFILLSTKAGTLRGYSELTGWLFRSTRYCAANAIKQQARRQRYEKEASVMRSQLAGETAEADWAAVAPVLDEAVAGLSSADRQAVLLRFYQGRSLADVGNAMGLGEEAAKKRVQRAVEKLRWAMIKKGVTISAGALVTSVVAEVTQAAPAGLAGLVAPAATGPAQATMAAAIAKGAANMMMWVKAKIVAAIVLATMIVAGGTALVAQVAMERKAPPARPAQRAGVGAPAVQPMRAGDMLFVCTWQAVTDKPLTDQIRAMAKPIATASKAYELMRCDGEALRQAVKSGMVGGGRVQVDNRLEWLDVARFPRAATGVPYIDLGAGTRFTGTVGGTYQLTKLTDGLELTISFPQARGEVASITGGPKIDGSIELKSPIGNGEAIVALGPLGRVGTDELTQLMVWQAVACSAPHAAYVQSVGGVSKWVQLGTDRLMKFADEGIAWASLATRPAGVGDPKWTQTLPHGGIVSLVGLCRPQEQPFIWWDGEGRPIVSSPVWSEHAGSEPLVAIVAVTDPADHANHAMTQGAFMNANYPLYAVIPVGEPKTGDEASVTVGFGAGPWRDVGTLKAGEQVAADGAAYRLAKIEAITNPSTVTKQWWLTATLAYTALPDVEMTLAAADKAGGQTLFVAVPQLLTSRVAGPQEQRAMPMQGFVESSPIDRLVVKNRPRHWATFANMAARADQTARLAPPVSVATEGWGEPDEGMQAQVAAEKAVWAAGMPIQLKVTIRNGGTQTLMLTRDMPRCRIEIDGGWYEVMPSNGNVVATEFASGQQAADLKISTEGLWRQESDHRPMELTPGRHVIRVAPELWRRYRDQGGTVRPISNAVTVEVQPGPTSRPAAPDMRAARAMFPRVREASEALCVAVEKGQTDAVADLLKKLLDQMEALQPLLKGSPAEAFNAQLLLGIREMSGGAKELKTSRASQIRSMFEDMLKLLEMQIDWFEAPTSRSDTGLAR